METNTFYSRNNTLFINACKLTGISATLRQASKFRRGLGLAYKVAIKEIKILKDKKGNFVKIIKQ